MLAEKWINNVISVKRYDHRCLQLRFLVGTTILNVICSNLVCLLRMLHSMKEYLA